MKQLLAEKVDEVVFNEAMSMKVGKELERDGSAFEAQLAELVTSFQTDINPILNRKVFRDKLSTWKQSNFCNRN